jgi:hypothetical protein
MADRSSSKVRIWLRAYSMIFLKTMLGISLILNIYSAYIISALLSMVELTAGLAGLLIIYMQSRLPIDILKLRKDNNRSILEDINDVKKRFEAKSLSYLVVDLCADCFWLISMFSMCKNYQQNMQIVAFIAGAGIFLQYEWINHTIMLGNKLQEEGVATNDEPDIGV